jgi:hypothetical protein
MDLLHKLPPESRSFNQTGAKKKHRKWFWDGGGNSFIVTNIFNLPINR